MADINQQTEELARIMEQVNREMAMYGQITKTTADQRRDAEIQAATGLKNFTKGAQTGADAVGELAGAAMSAGKAMLEGKKGAAAFNDSIDGMTKAATAAGIALTLLIPGGALIKGIVAGFTALTAATAGMVKASNEMADKLYKSYSGLAKSGAAASDGMTGVFNDAKKLGLSMNELDSFVGLVGENAGDLALFAGSVFEGRQKFAEMGEAMEPYRKQMIAAGLTQEEINEGAMGYLRLQTRLGRSQTMTTEQLAEGARKYIVEQDQLTKLTGQSRKQAEDAMEAARSEQRFRAKLEEVRLTQGEDAAKRLERANVMISSQSKEMGQAFRDISTNMLGTEAAQKGMMGTQGELMTSTQKLIAGQSDEFEAVTAIGKAAGQFAKDMNMTAQLGTFNEIATDYAGALRLGIFAEKDRAEVAKIIDEEQKKQGLKGAKAADGIVDQYAENIKQQQELNKKMEQTVFAGIENALVITNKLGDVTDSLATGFEVLGKAVNKLLNVLGLGVPERAITKEEQEANKKADDAKKAFEESVKDAGMAAKLFGIGLTDQQKQLKQQQKDAEENALMQKQQQESRYKVEKQITEGEKRRAERTGVNAPVGGKQELPAGVAPSTAGGGRGSVAPPASSPPASPAPAPATGAAPASPAPASPAPASPAPAPATGAAPAAPATAQPVSLSPQPLEGEAGKDDGVKLEDILKFTARSGSQQAFEGLDNNFKKAVIAAAEQYKAATGNPIQINSAKRDPADQERLYAETVKLGTPGIGPTGMKVAKPGRSLHERGHAVDIQQYKDSAAIAAFNAQGLFQKVPNDPVHFQAREGGVFDGPDTGYDNITLHGTEAVIPLKNGAVPVRLFGDETAKSAESAAPDAVLQNLLTELVGSVGAAPDSGPGQADISASLNNMQSNMFASIQSLQASVMDSKFDIDLRRDIVEPGVDQETQTATKATEQVVSGDNSAITQMLKDAKEANFAMLDMISELVREQRNANDISTRILQVSSN